MKVKSSLEKVIESKNLSSRVGKILLPAETVLELRKGKKVVKQRKFFPGYLLISMDIDNETYWLVRNTQGVTGFLGGVEPTPVREEEINRLLELMTVDPGAKPKPALLFEKGENVRINEGPFKHFVGVVEEVDENKGKIKVMVTIFGRATPVELDYLQVEKL